MSPYYFFYSIFNMSSYRKPEIQNPLTKITKSQVNLLFCFPHNFDRKSLTMLILAPI